MKIFNFYERINIPELCYNTVHMHGSLSKVLDCNATSFDDASHALILDVPNTIEENAQRFIDFRKNGGKVTLMVFDPFRFPRVDRFIEQKMLDMVVLFDQRFQNRFTNIKSYVTDYFFNQDVFPTNEVSYKNEACVFGHLLHGRHNKYNLSRVDEYVNSYEELYTNVRMFNGVMVLATGLDETGGSIITHNKAKAVETLMCGRNPYCGEGINTIYYNQYLKKYEDIPNLKEVDFSQEVIFNINKQVLEQLANEIVNI